MPDARFKFRCYRCNQLIGVLPRKAGATIACPRCGADLLVPQPDSSAPASEVERESDDAPRERKRAETGRSKPESGQEQGPAIMSEIAAAIPDDLAMLRPEDIRVEAEFANLVVTSPQPVAPAAAVVAPAEDPPEYADDQPAPFRPVLDVPAAGAGAARDTGRADGVTPQAAWPTIAVDAPPATAPLGASLPAITIEPATIRADDRDRDVRPAREVVLQPATVLAWSLLVLMAVPLAFISGLMLGHFVWR